MLFKYVSLSQADTFQNIQRKKRLCEIYNSGNEDDKSVYRMICSVNPMFFYWYFFQKRS